MSKTLEDIVTEMGEKLNILIGALSSGGVLSPAPQCKYAFYAWFDEWYASYKAPKLKPSSLYQIRNCFKNHIKPYLHDVPLNELKPLELQKALNSIESSRMRKYTRDTLGDCLRQAYKLEYIPTNPMDKVDGVAHTRKKGLSLSREQEQHFLQIIKGNKLENVYLFYLASGCRKSELLAIKWEHVDYTNNRLYIDGTKTTCAKRYIPLFDDIKTILTRQSKTSVFVFPYREYVISNSFRWLKNKYGLPYSIHSLRHTFSTRHYENGIKDKTIQKWMGHSKVQTTQDIYTDVLTEFENGEIERANSTRKLLI